MTRIHLILALLLAGSWGLAAAAPPATLTLLDWTAPDTVAAAALDSSALGGAGADLAHWPRRVERRAGRDRATGDTLRFRYRSLEGRRHVILFEREVLP